MAEKLYHQVAAATAKVMGEVRRLRKADNNAFAKYRYTSVDDFKDALRPLMAKHGLTPNADEVTCELFDRTDDKNKTSAHVRFTFSLWLEHVSGEEGKPERLTVMLPYVGAQTSGAARSYAIKEWVKSKFLASSGDSEDADQHDVTEELSKSEARPIYTELEKELREAAVKGKEAMEEWVDRRRPSIEILPKDWRVLLQKEYREQLATCGRRAVASTEATIDPDAFLTNLYAALGTAPDGDSLEQLWDEWDVEATLTGDEDMLQRAFDMKKDRMEALDAKAVRAA